MQGKTVLWISFFAPDTATANQESIQNLTSHFPSCKIVGAWQIAFAIHGLEPVML